MNIWYGKVVSSDRNVPFRDKGAAGKARQDAYQFLNEIGAQPLNVFSYSWPDEPDESLNPRMDGIFAGVKFGDVVIQFYPNATNSPKYNQFFINKAHAFGAKVVGYIHDLEFYRGNYKDYIRGEVNVPFQYMYALNDLNKYDALMVPTENMANRIRQDLNYQQPIVITGPHGYKTPMIPDRREKSNTVVFAGSFEKNLSLNKLMDASSEIMFNIYGGASGEYGAEAYLEEHPNAELRGKYDPDALLMLLEGSYGLVWDSLDYPEVTGGKGFYEILNTPHKFSMYLAAELPVIVWSRMGLADYVLKNNIGWVIDDLSQLQDLVQNITEADYNKKLDNLQSIGSLIRSGIQFKNSVFEVSSIVNEIAAYDVTSEEFPAPELGTDEWIIEMNNYDPEGLKKANLSFKLKKFYSDDIYKNTQYKKAQGILKELKIID